MRPSVLALLALAVAGAACSRAPQSTAEVKLHVASPTELIKADDVRALAGKVEAIIHSESGEGDVMVGDVIKVMPMRDVGRSTVVRAFPAPMRLRCNRDTRLCEGLVTGRAVSAPMSFTIAFLSDPTLELSPTLSARLFLRSSNELELCNVEGMKVRKFFVTRAVDGVNLSLVNGQPKLVVDAGDEFDDFRCR